MSHLNAIVVFNTDRFIGKQADLVSNNVGGKILIVDNSTDFDISHSLKTIADVNNYDYLKTNISENDFSKSHAYACTVALEMYRNYYDSILFLDHDIFPYKKITLEENYYLTGVQQIRRSPKDAPHQVEISYMWPGCLFVNTFALDEIEIDLTPQVVSEIFLDTGGGLYKIIEGNKDHVKFIPERHEDDYSIIDESWMHFRNGGNWKGEKDHEERIERLMNVLESKL